MNKGFNSLSICIYLYLSASNHHKLDSPNFDIISQCLIVHDIVANPLRMRIESLPQCLLCLNPQLDSLSVNSSRLRVSLNSFSFSSSFLSLVLSYSRSYHASSFSLEYHRRNFPRLRHFPPLLTLHSKKKID